MYYEEDMARNPGLMDQPDFGPQPPVGQQPPPVGEQPPAGPQPGPQPGDPNQYGPQRPGTSSSSAYGRTSSPVRAGVATQSVQGNQLMSNQINSLLDSDGPYMQRARQSGLNLAHQRGLGNSSIAAGNAMGAAIDRAAPIAQFDAGRYGSVADQNMAARNRASLANAEFAIQDQRTDLMSRELDSKNWQDMYSGYMNSVNAIYMNPNMSPEQQAAAVANLRSSVPGFANEAWQALPPGLISNRAVQSAQMMPPMPPLRGTPATSSPNPVTGSNAGEQYVIDNLQNFANP